ncbi:MAG: hypothetical protein WKF84_18130 [Pyrinomonadaceae bacterium]
MTFEAIVSLMRTEFQRLDGKLDNRPTGVSGERHFDERIGHVLLPRPITVAISRAVVKEEREMQFADDVWHQRGAR